MAMLRSVVSTHDFVMDGAPKIVAGAPIDTPIAQSTAVVATDLVQCIADPLAGSAARKIGRGVNRQKYHIGPALEEQESRRISQLLGSMRRGKMLAGIGWGGTRSHST